jgi:RNA polymerase sigma-54 factor
MGFSQRLEMRQGQSLVMTPQLLQAIKLLQLSHIDLAAYVEAELEQNPLLERAEPDDGPDEVPAARDDARSDGAYEGGEDGEPWLAQDLETSRSSLEGDLDTRLDNVFPDETATPERMPSDGMLLGPSAWTGVGVGGSDGHLPDFEATLKLEASLSEHLAAQLDLSTRDARERLIAGYLIDSLDEGGYFRDDLADVAQRLGAPIEAVEAALRRVQSFDPPGIGARDLPECLALQLKERDRFDPAMAALLSRLDLLARRDFAALRQLCGVDDEDLSEMVAEIRRLEPKPARPFGAAPVQVLVPDVFVRVAPDGGWLVELNPDTLPRVLVNQTYYARVSRTAKKDGDKSFLTECLQNASWLTRSLEQRAKTILKVATEIVRQQDGFFVNGVAHLRPLNLKTVADAIGMHESTVSRVTSNKSIGTTRGTFEMKYFFTASIAGAAGADAHSSEAVRHRVRLLIDAERAEDVLSDDALVQKLKAEGVEIARRTVAKYRESLHIPSSIERRREKQARARQLARA